MKTACVSTALPSEINALDIFRMFIHEPYPFLLDSSLYGDTDGRYAVIGFAPDSVFSGRSVSDWENMKDSFRRVMTNAEDMDVPFSGGLVGWMGYDFGLKLEGIAADAMNSEVHPDFVFGLYNSNIVLDLTERKVYIIVRNACLKTAHTQCSEIMKRVDLAVKYACSYPVGLADSFVSDRSREDYVDAVHKALAYIAAGDIYQVNISQRFSMSLLQDITVEQAFDVYALLRSISPSMFSAFFGMENRWLLSSSPERFLKLADGRAEIKPMKGTRSRGQTAEEDKQNYQDLLLSEKEKAELLMVTDLERNDLGRVCRYGTVQVESLRDIETYSTVFQATSTVRGDLREQMDAFDLIESCFPGGSITGCPKIRSMQIIQELERSPRNFYTGALGYIGFDGAMDMNMLIRTVMLKEAECVFHVGSGIVADSDPDKEYEETLIKARAMRDCLSQAFKSGAV